MHQLSQTIEASNLNQNLLSALGQEVDLGVHALQRGDADMAVTLHRQKALSICSMLSSFFNLFKMLILR